LNGLSGEGNIEKMFLVEKGLRELASLKVSGHILMLTNLANISGYEYHIICLFLKIFATDDCTHIHPWFL
jgi:hypothetical protein